MEAVIAVILCQTRWWIKDFSQTFCSFYPKLKWSFSLVETDKKCISCLVYRSGCCKEFPKNLRSPLFGSAFQIREKRWSIVNSFPPWWCWRWKVLQKSFVFGWSDVISMKYVNTWKWFKDCCARFIHFILLSYSIKVSSHWLKDRCKRHEVWETWLESNYDRKDRTEARQIARMWPLQPLTRIFCCQAVLHQPLQT